MGDAGRAERRFSSGVLAIGSTVVVERRRAVIESGVAAGRWTAATGAAGYELAADIGLVLDAAQWERFLDELDGRLTLIVRRSSIHRVGRTL